MVSHPSNVDYYKELGVSRHASAAEIRSAYKRLALVWHPDRNKAKGAEEKFKTIKQAHDVLTDDSQRREYDQQQEQQACWFDAATNVSYAPSTPADQFNLHTFEQFMAPPVDPFDIISDIQCFQDPDFTAKMVNSPSYRNLYTQLFNTMNNEPPSRSKGHAKRASSKRFSANIPVIHSTMPHDWFLNELIDIYEQQSHGYAPSASLHIDPFFDELTHCTVCQRKVAGDRAHLLQHEQSCRDNHPRYTSMPSTTSVRV